LLSEISNFCVSFDSPSKGPPQRFFRKGGVCFQFG
jgi:hypothetical protein